MKTLKRLIVLSLILLLLYYIFIANFWVTVGVIASLFVAFRLYKFYAKWQLNKLSGSKTLFRESELGHFIALVAKVAKSDGRVSELEAQLISMMFDDISKVFTEKEKTRNILKEIFNEEKARLDDTREIAESLNILLGRSILKRKQFITFLTQLAFVDNGVSADEEKVLLVIVEALEINTQEYQEILQKFENMKQNQQQGMSLEEAYKVLDLTESDDMNTIKKKHRSLVRKYHPDIIKSQDKDESYMEEATAKTQEINQAYQVIKDAKK